MRKENNVIVIRINEDLKSQLFCATGKVGTTASEVIRNKISEFVESVNNKKKMKEG